MLLLFVDLPLVSPLCATESYLIRIKGYLSLFYLERENNSSLI